MLIIQVNRLVSKTHVINRLFFSTSIRCCAKVLFPLESKQLLKISGDEAPEFLQGLITNDMRHFEDGTNSMYAMFLNNKGRVLFDTLLHKWENKSFLIECDKKISSLLEKHLKIFKLKRAVKIEDASNLNLWGLISPGHGLPDLKQKLSSDINIYKDPRLAELGCRIVASSMLSAAQISDKIDKDITTNDNEEAYTYLRYKLGVGEGCDDLPPGVCFPLEVNCDYLHGVSFHKGCYIGQELTARVYHTGVVRKRLMPLKFTENEIVNLEKDTMVAASDQLKSNLGKLKGFVQDYGLGLLRVKEAMEAKMLSIGNYTAEVVKPTWWPVEAPKEIISKDKS